MGTVRFGKEHFAPITGYKDYVHGNVTICHVYYVEGLRYNLFSVGQLCDSDLEVAFCSKTCYVRNLKGEDILTGAPDSNLYTISISDMATSSPVCLMSKATSTKSWLWHRRLSHLNFGTINHLTKQDLVDGLTKTPQQNGVVERRNQTLVEAARTMLIFLKAPKFLWAEAISTAYFMQNRSLVHTRYNKTPYELLKNRKPNVRTWKIMETIHVKFDELTAMASEHNSLESKANRLNVEDSSPESNQTPLKEDLDDLFGPLYEEYFEKRPPKVSTNSAAPTSLNNEDTPSSSTIIIDENEAPPLVSTSKEQTTSISNDVANESIQEDFAELDGNTFITSFCPLVIEEAESSSTNQDPSNMHEFNQLHP
ncbi:integrase, catalytic region, zinc finger, CCHC-type containing protein [Tanacetum coccineum]